MPDDLTPGVEIQELPNGPRPIEGVSTSTAGMSGVTERGPAEPQLITSWKEYQDCFGGFVEGAVLPAAVYGFFENGGRRVYVASAADARIGLAALEVIDEISILLAPDDVNDSSGESTSTVIEQCERLRDRFAIVSAPRDVDRVDALRPPRESSYAAFYAPWIRVLDPARRQPLLVPASGHVAGIYARVDLERGVHKAPANEVVHGLVPHDAASGVEPLQVTTTSL